MPELVLPWDQAIRDMLRAAYLVGWRDCLVFCVLALLVWQHVRTPPPR